MTRWETSSTPAIAFWAGVNIKTTTKLNIKLRTIQTPVSY
jgi:hypothetical protein